MMPPPTPRSAGRGPVVVLVVVAVLLAGAAVWLFTAAGSTSTDADRVAAEAERTRRAADRLTEGVDAANQALTDAEVTRDVTDQLRVAIERTFSYDHADLDATARAVDRYLTGEARCVYDELFAQVKELAPAQQLVLRTAVREIALTSLTGDEAVALVFIDQSSARGDSGKAVAGQAQFAVGTRLDGDTWQVTRLDFFDQPMIDGQAAPQC